MTRARFPISLDGREYQVDLSYDPQSAFAFRRESIPLIRDQQDTSDLAGEQSISREDLWRRSQETWEGGAGQSVLDRRGSDIERFRTSRGIDPWDKWQLKLLRRARRIKSASDNNQRLLVAGSRLYHAFGSTLEHTDDLSDDPVVWADGGITTSIEDMATDGKLVYVATQDDIRTTTIGSTSSSVFWSSPDNGAVHLVAYAKGRLIAATVEFGGSAFPYRLWNVTSGSTQVELTPSDFNDNWTWTTVGDGPGGIYAAGFSGDKCRIFRIAITPEGTSLGAPVEVGRLPDGEIARVIGSYLGVCVIGTDKGLRLALVSGEGLSIGPLIATDAAVECFEPQGRFIWFGSNTTGVDSDGTKHAGLYRADLLTFTSPLTPAYAPDLRLDGGSTTPSDHHVTSVVTFPDPGTTNERRVFTVWDTSGVNEGLWAEELELVDEGYIDSGLITYGLPDAKVISAVDLRHQQLHGAIELDIAVDGGDFTNVLTSSVLGSKTPGFTVLSPSLVTKEAVEARLRLKSDYLNGGFEDGEDDWTFIVPAGTPSNFWAVVSSDARSGSKALKFTGNSTIDGSGDDISARSLLIPVQGGEELHLIGYVKSGGGGTAGTARIRITEHDANQNEGASTASGSSVTTATSYQRLEVAYTVPASGVSFVQVRLTAEGTNIDRSFFYDGIHLILGDGPVLTRYTIFALPTPQRTEAVLLPLLLHSSIRTRDQQQSYVDTHAEFTALKAMEASGQTVDYIEGAQPAVKAIVQEVAFIPHEPNESGWFDGLCMVRLKVIG